MCVWLYLTNTSESYMANNRNIWWRCRVTSTATWNVPRAATPIPGMAPEAGPERWWLSVAYEWLMNLFNGFFMVYEHLFNIV